MSQINFALVLSNQSNTEALSNILFNKGIISINIEKPEDVPIVLKNKKIDFLFLDFDFSNNASFDLMQKLQNDDKYSSLYIIATSFNTNELFTKKLEQFNIVGFIPKPLFEEQISNKLNIIFENLKDHIPARKHIRVKPSDDELVRLCIKLKRGKNLTAKIIDISMGGISGLLYNDFQDIELSPGNLIEHLIFEVNHKYIDVDGKLITKKDKFITFKFTHFYSNTNKDLAKYILKKLSI